MDKPDDTIRFREAGVLFEIFGPDVLGERQVAVTDAAGSVDGFGVPDWTEACRKVDDWLDRNLAPESPGRFRGFRLLLLRHEGGIEEEVSYLTRGKLLEWFDNGIMPDLDELVDLAECAGDKVLEIRDGAGTLLVERRAEAGIGLRIPA